MKVGLCAVCLVSTALWWRWFGYACVGCRHMTADQRQAEMVKAQQRWTGRYVSVHDARTRQLDGVA